MLDSELASLLPPDIIDTGEEWRLVQRASKAGLTETGVVSRLSAPLAAAKLSELYLSTFLTAFILVPTSRFDEAVECWRKSGIVVTDA